ncbi:MAG: YqfO family protein [Gammaproteobacteria bacterium]|nr:YqfO family protein [Gammaproteobacteria bacterium]
MYKLCVYIPQSHLEQVKAAIFEAGGGKIGNYDNCCWQTQGQGQFRPLINSQPFTGQPGKVETVEEVKIELVVENSLIKQVIASMKKAHPYEEPAYDAWLLANI